MTVKLCPDEVIAAVLRKQGKEISREEAESIVDQLNDWIKNHKGSVGEDTINKMYTQAAKIALNAKIAAKIEKRNALLNKRAYVLSLIHISEPTRP